MAAESVVFTGAHLGTTATSFHLRITRDEGAAGLSEACGRAGAVGYLSDVMDGWATLLDRRADAQEEAWLATLVERLAKASGRPCVLVYLHDSDVFGFRLCDAAGLVCRFEAAGRMVSARSGELDRLAELGTSFYDRATRLGLIRSDFLPGFAPRQHEPLIGERRFRALAQVLGTPLRRMSLSCAGLDHVDDEWALPREELPVQLMRMVEDARRFTPVG